MLRGKSALFQTLVTLHIEKYCLPFGKQTAVKLCKIYIVNVFQLTSSVNLRLIKALMRVDLYLKYRNGCKIILDCVRCKTITTQFVMSCW